MIRPGCLGVWGGVGREGLNFRPGRGIHPGMRTLLATALLAATLAIPRPASAQVTVTLHLDLPAVLPALVVIEPGIQVVPRVNEEIFLVDGFYWVRRDARWYRSHDHRSGWVVVDARGVPSRLVTYPPGQYRKWDPSKDKSGKHGGKHDDDHGKQGKDKGKDKGHGKD